MKPSSHCTFFVCLPPLILSFNHVGSSWALPISPSFLPTCILCPIISPSRISFISLSYSFCSLPQSLPLLSCASFTYNLSSSYSYLGRPSCSIRLLVPPSFHLCNLFSSFNIGLGFTVFRRLLAACACAS